MGLQELLLHMHPLAAMLLPGIMLIAMAAIPYWDKNEDNIGLYFRSTVGKMTAVAGAILGLVLIPLLVLIDEFWLDLPALLPNWATLISNGLIPLLLSLAALFIIYQLFRLLFKANQSEALVGLFSFIVTGFILLTLVGVYFRGANMGIFAYPSKKVYSRITPSFKEHSIHWLWKAYNKGHDRQRYQPFTIRSPIVRYSQASTASKIQTRTSSAIPFKGDCLEKCALDAFSFHELYFCLYQN